jgi:hypothetical protein
MIKQTAHLMAAKRKEIYRKGLEFYYHLQGCAPIT